jgi:ParB family transcriptional regulator, chromosome partitioning protein
VTEALLGCLTDQDADVRRLAVEALAGPQDPRVTEALLGCLADQDKEVRHSAVRALDGREGSRVTEALLGCLADQDEDVRVATVEALADREGSRVTEALLGCLADQDEDMRYGAVEALGGRKSPETLLILASKVRTLSQPSLREVTDAAESLMIRHYRRIDPADQPEVLAAMGWLTTAVLSDRSA